jgi:Fic family protein
MSSLVNLDKAKTGSIELPSMMPSLYHPRITRTRPIIDAAKVGAVTETSPASAYKLIADLVQFGILEEITGGKRGKQYMFMAYLRLFN